MWGASVVKNKKLEFCKKGFGERSNSSLERVRRGEEDGIVGGDQGGVGGGGNGGENGGEVLKVMVVLVENGGRRWWCGWC